MSAAGVSGVKLGSCKARAVLWENELGSGGFHSHYLGAEK